MRNIAVTIEAAFFVFIDKMYLMTTLAGEFFFGVNGFCVFNYRFLMAIFAGGFFEPFVMRQRDDVAMTLNTCRLSMFKFR